MGSLVFAGSILGCFFLDALTIDIGAMIVLSIGLKVRQKGSRKAAKWGVAFMVNYAVVSALIAAGVSLGWPPIKVGARPLPPSLSPWVATAMALNTLWAAFNLHLLIRFLREPCKSLSRGFSVLVSQDSEQSPHDVPASPSAADD